MTTVISNRLGNGGGVLYAYWSGDPKIGTSPASPTSPTPDLGKLDPIRSAGSGNPSRDVDNGNGPRGGGNEFPQSPWNDGTADTRRSGYPSGDDIPDTSSRDFNQPWSDNAQGDRKSRTHLSDGHSPEGPNNPATATHMGAGTSYSGMPIRSHATAMHASADIYGVSSWIPAGTGTLAVGNVKPQVAGAAEGFVRTILGGNSSVALPGLSVIVGPMRNLVADPGVVPVQNPMTSVISAKSLAPLDALPENADVPVPVARMNPTQSPPTVQGVQHFSQPQAPTTTSGRDTNAQGLAQWSAQLVGVQRGRVGSQQTAALAGLGARLAGSISAVARAQVSLAQATLVQELGRRGQDKAAPLTSGMGLRRQRGATEVQGRAALLGGTTMGLHGDLEKKSATRGSGHDEAATSELQQGDAMPRELVMRLAAAPKVCRRRSYDRVERVDRFTPRTETPEMEDEKFWEEFGGGASPQPFDDAPEGQVETVAQAAVEHYRAMWIWLRASDQQVLLHELKRGRCVMVMAPPDATSLCLIGHLLWPDASDAVRVAGTTGRAWLLAAKWSAALPADTQWRQWRQWRLRQWVDGEGVWQVAASQPDRHTPRLLLSDDGKQPVAVGEYITVLDPLRLRRLMGRQWTMTVLRVPMPLDGKGVQSDVVESVG